jgi:predicted amidophosphoribosyltransferase
MKMQTVWILVGCIAVAAIGVTLSIPRCSRPHAAKCTSEKDNRPPISLCPVCGAGVLPDALFCLRCGAPTKVMSATQFGHPWGE